MTYPADWTDAEIREDRAERAAIMEYEGGLSRAAAELLAHWTFQPPVVGIPDRRLWGNASSREPQP